MLICILYQFSTDQRYSSFIARKRRREILSREKKRTLQNAIVIVEKKIKPKTGITSSKS